MKHPTEIVLAASYYCKTDHIRRININGRKSVN